MASRTARTSLEKLAMRLTMASRIGKEPVAARIDRARPLHRVDELGQRPERQRLERPAFDGETGERLGQPLPGAQRERGILLEEADGLGCRALERGHVLRIADRLDRLEPSAPERRQRQRRDVGDDAVEFERASSKHDG